MFCAVYDVIVAADRDFLGRTGHALIYRESEHARDKRRPTAVTGTREMGDALGPEIACASSFLPRPSLARKKFHDKLHPRRSSLPRPEDHHYRVISGRLRGVFLLRG